MQKRQKGSKSPDPRFCRKVPEIMRNYRKIPGNYCSLPLDKRVPIHHILSAGPKTTPKTLKIGLKIDFLDP